MINASLKVEFLKSLLKWYKVSFQSEMSSTNAPMHIVCNKKMCQLINKLSMSKEHWPFLYLTLSKTPNPCWFVCTLFLKNQVGKIMLDELDFYCLCTHAKINFEIDLYMQKIVELVFSNLIFQNSSTDQQGAIVEQK